MTRTPSTAARARPPAAAARVSAFAGAPFRPRARLLAGTVLTGGTLRSLAAAAGMMTVLGVSPALAQCFSGAGGVLNTAACDAAATGTASTAVGSGANATGDSATAYGANATATGDFAT